MRSQQGFFFEISEDGGVMGSKVAREGAGHRKCLPSLISSVAFESVELLCGSPFNTRNLSFASWRSGSAMLLADVERTAG